MHVNLTHRHYGIHELVKEAEIPGALADYATVKPDSGSPYDGCEFTVDETKLLAALPEGFLPVPARSVLLGIDDTAQSDLSQFRNWAKYFDAYMLWLVTPERLAADPTR